MKKRANPNADLFMREFFGEDYTEEDCNRARDMLRGVAYTFTSCEINFNMETPQFTPAIDSNRLLLFADELIKEEDDQL
ncbi:MAG: hypothetical protein ACO3CQ_02730 [Candidatus Nanopelagicaceae bacterium]